MPDKTAPAQGKVVSETRTYTQEAYSSTSRVETVTGKSTVERKEKHHSTVTHKHMFNVSSSPVDRDRKIHILSQSRSSSQETPPPSVPTAPSFSDIQREFQIPRKDRAGFTHRPPQEGGHSGSQVCTVLHCVWIPGTIGAGFYDLKVCTSTVAIIALLYKLNKHG